MLSLKSIIKEYNYALIFLILGVFLIFSINLKPPLDPDFGWHLRIGQDLISGHSLSYFDPYSFTMSDFPWISYSWLADIIIALIEKYFGIFALSLFFAGINSISFLLAAKAAKANPACQIIAALLAAILSASVATTRPHAFSLLGLSGLIFLLLRWRQNADLRIILCLPPIFALWSNLHPGFAIGLFLFFVFVLVGAIFAKAKIAPSLPSLKNIIFIFFLSLVATLVNPYGLGIWTEILRTGADFFGRSQIIEWQPLYNAGAPVFLPTLIFAALLFGSQFFLKKRHFILIVISAIFFIFSLLAWRNLALFFIACSPLTALTIESLTAKQLLKIFASPILILAIFVATIYLGWQNIKQTWLTVSSPAALAQKAQFPLDAIQFLKNGPLAPNGNHLFNEFNWGGYILWQMPGQKVFIDGRMPHWKLPDRHIFADYQTLQAAKSLNNINFLIQKYNLDSALIRADSPLSFKLQLLGWQRIYQDNISILLKK